MSELEYKEALAIELNDIKLMIAKNEYYRGSSGIYSDYFETDVDYEKFIAEDINQLLYNSTNARFDVDIYKRIISNIAEMARQYQKPTSDNLEGIFVATNQNGSINIKLVYCDRDGQYNNHITYNGSYSVLWKDKTV